MLLIPLVFLVVTLPHYGDSGNTLRFTRSFVCPSPAPSGSSYFRISNFQIAAIHSNIRSVPSEGWVGSVKWREVQSGDDAVRLGDGGALISKSGSAGLGVEWVEPVARKALIFTFASRFLINGHLETGHINGWGVRQLVPVALKKGTNQFIAAGSANFQLLSIKAPISFLMDTIVAPDAKLGEQGPFVASIVAVNAGDVATRASIQTQVDNGPVTSHLTELVPAMDSRIVRFDFMVSSHLKPGNHHLKLWGKGIDPCDLKFLVADRGVVRRCTYVSRFDGMVRGYSILESLQPSNNQPIVLFTYGGGRTSESQLSMIHARRECHVVSPDFRTSNWDGLGRRDALETLDVAAKRLQADRSRMYLLGHSMGGHAVYVMSSINPKAFAGIGLSAAWLSNFTYISDTYPEVITADPIAKIFRKAMSETDLEGRLDDIAATKNVWMMHGDADQSVPISESFRILNALEARGTKVEMFVQRHANHFWSLPNGEGNQYDFPPLLQGLLRSSHRGTGNLWGGKPVTPFWAECMGRRSVAVYSTAGSPEENQDSFDRARREAAIARESFMVDCQVVPDTVTNREIAGRNIVMFGTPKSNRLWKLHPTAGKLLNRATSRGYQLSSWMIQGRCGNQIWSAIGGINAVASRLAYYYNPYDSYRRYPQWILFDGSVATKGLGGVTAAGFIDGPEAWRNAKLSSQ